MFGIDGEWSTLWQKLKNEESVCGAVLKDEELLLCNAKLKFYVQNKPSNLETPPFTHNTRNLLLTILAKHCLREKEECANDLKNLSI